MTKDDPHSPEAVVERIRYRYCQSIGEYGAQSRPFEEALSILQPGDRPREGLVVVPNKVSGSIWHTLYDYGVEADTVENCFRDLLTAASGPEDSRD